MDWNPEDFKRDDDDNSNSQDAAVALLRNLTGSAAVRQDLQTRMESESFKSDFVLSHILVELKIMNRHLAEMRNEVIEGDDIE